MNITEAKLPLKPVMGRFVCTVCTHMANTNNGRERIWTHTSLKLGFGFGFVPLA